VPHRDDDNLYAESFNLDELDSDSGLFADGFSYDDLEAADEQDDPVPPDAPPYDAKLSPAPKAKGRVGRVRERITQARELDAAAESQDRAGEGWLARKLAQIREARQLSAADQDDQDAPRRRGGWLARKLAQIKAARTSAADMPEAPNFTAGPAAAGLDVSAPSLSERLAQRLRKPRAANTTSSPGGDELAPPDGFAALLRPLSEPEILALQEQLRDDEALIVRFDRHRRRGRRAEKLGLVCAAAGLVGFFFLAGGGYLSGALLDEPLPGAWNDIAHFLGLRGPAVVEVMHGLMFGLGLLLPFSAAVMCSDGLGRLFRGLAIGQPDAVIVGTVLALTAVSMWVVLLSLNPWAALLLNVFGIAARLCAGIVVALSRAAWRRVGGGR
jgi:hypothetical protein